jgi:hypothetical protein
VLDDEGQRVHVWSPGSVPRAHGYEALASVDTFLLGRGTFEKFSARYDEHR